MSRIPHLVFSSSLWAQWNTYGMNSGFSSLCESQSFVNTLLSLLSCDTKEFGIWYMPALYTTLHRRLPQPLALGVTWAVQPLPLPTRWPIIRASDPRHSRQHAHVTDCICIAWARCCCSRYWGRTAQWGCRTGPSALSSCLLPATLLFLHTETILEAQAGGLLCLFFFPYLLVFDLGQGRDN